MSGGLIRAGGAFVELLMNDEAVRRALDENKARLIAWGASVDAVGVRSLTTMSTAAASTSIAAAGSVGVLTTSMSLLRATTISVGAVFRAAFGIITTSVTSAVAGIGLITLAIARYAPAGGVFSRLFSSFLSNSQTTEALGRWTRFLGMISGSAALRSLGNRVERLGLGAAIVQGFRSGGLVGGISATFGAAMRSAKSIIARTAVGLFTSPIRAALSMGRTVGQQFRIIGPTATAQIPAVAKLSAAIRGTSASGSRLAGLRSILNSLGASMQSLAIRAVAFAAVITGPAFLAARSFAKSASEITDEAKKTGKTIAELILSTYGKGSLISPDDIKAGKDLSDAMTEAKDAIKVAWAQIGIAALPILKAMAESSKQLAEAISGVLGANRGLLTSIITAAAKIGGMSAAMLVTYKGAVMLAPILSALASPLGLIAVGVVAVAIAFPQVRQAAMETFNYLFGNFGELLTIVQETATGIMDALAGGSIQAAGKVLWTGLYAAWIIGSEQLRAVYRTLVNNIASFGIDAFAGLQTAWVEVTRFMADAWAIVVRGFVDSWKGAQNTIAGGFARVIAKMTGQNVNDVLATLKEMQDQEAKANTSGFDQAMTYREKLAKQKLEDIEKERKETQAALQEDFKTRESQAAAARELALKEFKAAKDEAAKLRAKRFETSPTSRTSSELVGNVGTFSAATAGRIGIAGLSKLEKDTEKTAAHTAEIAKNTKDLKGLAFA